MRDMPLVFMDGLFKLAMGVRSLAIEDWLILDERWEEEVALRRRLSLERRDLVYEVLPETEPACRELLAILVDWLARHGGERFERSEDGLRVRSTGEQVRLDDPEPLLACGRLVQEDLLLLVEAADGLYRLGAGHLCFPLHWKLADKIGRPVGEIHGPVPGFSERLGSPVDRLFHTLEVDRPVWRANWSLTSTPELCRPDRSDHLHTLEPLEAGRSLWLRVERQTLRRLPRTRAILFTVKTYVVALEEAVRRQGVAAALAARLREMPDAVAAYKGLLAIRSALLQWLDARTVRAQELAAQGR